MPEPQKNGNASGKDKIKVAIRIRPFNNTEKSSGCKNIIEMKESTTKIYDESDSKKPPKTFSFDECFWSVNSADNNFASQDIVFEKLGLGVLDNAFNGYNACILAYGQTGSGKSYTMMGTQNDPGIIPRLCNEMFSEIKKRTMHNIRYQVEVTYCEIYNEKVTDLLSVQSSSSKPSNSKDYLKVREDATYGPYVEGATREIVKDSHDIQKLMDMGNKSRSMASTCFNKESSRSHAVFEITLTEQHIDENGKPMNQMGEKRSKISLVDLAGSEKVSQTGTTSKSFTEGVNINKSLLTLMTVVKLLAHNQQAKKGKQVHIPYRDSKLTYLLKENIGGNSKTVIIATISPASYSYSETLSTLNYANTAKSIETRAVVNEDKSQEQIELMQKELERQKDEIQKLSQLGEDAQKLKYEYEEQSRRYEEAAKSWEVKYQESVRQAQERESALLKMGISLEATGLKVDRKRVYLVNISVDPSLNEMLVYYLNEYNKVGTGDDQTIQIRGLGMQKEHCIIEVTEEGVFIDPIDNAKICVTGIWISERTKLKNSERIMLGVSNIYKINIPKQKLNTNESAEADNTNEADDMMEEEYETAQEEIMKSQMKDDPIQLALGNLETLYTSEKNQALEEQKKEYEKQMALINEKYEEALSKMSTSTISTGGPGQDPYNQSMSASMYQGTGSMGPYGSMANVPMALQSSFATIPQIKDGDWSQVPNWMSSHQNLMDSHSIMSHIQTQFKQWYSQKEKNFSLLLHRLKEQLLKANRLTIEANYLANELAKRTTYKVTLQIPASSLNPNGNKHGLISEPAILVSRDDKPAQIWSLDKLDSKVIQMREVFEELKDVGCPNRKQLGNPFNIPDDNTCSGDSIKEDPFFDAEDEHRLIGVANVYLRCLFNRIKFKYDVPIINQQGETSGKLTVELSVVNGDLPDLCMRDSSTGNNINSMTSSVYSGQSYPGNMMTGGQDDTNSNCTRSASGYSLGAPITIRVRVLHATGLPESLSKFVYCQYRFFQQPEHTIVAPVLQPDFVHRNLDQHTSSFKFNSVTDFALPLSDDLLEHLAEDAVSIEVLGNYSPPPHGSDAVNTRSHSRHSHSQHSGTSVHPSSNFLSGDIDINSDPKLIRKFAERWMELYRRLELWVCIEELNEEGVYEKAELLQLRDIECGGIFQLHHGHSRKLRVYIRPNKITKGCRGKLPLAGHHIEEVSIGDVIVVQKSPTYSCSIDSYQESDLMRLREAWRKAEMKRKEYLKTEINKIPVSDDPESDRGTQASNPEDQARLQTLMKQLLRLTYESQAVIVPPEGSGIPGAPATWSPTPGMEKHCPVLFLNNLQDSPPASPSSQTSPNLEDLDDNGEPLHPPCVLDQAGNLSTLYGTNCELNSPTTSSPLVFWDGENSRNLLPLPICKRYSDCWGVLCQWDAGLHDNLHLNKVTAPSHLVYLTCRVVLKLQTPPHSDLVLRKRICVNIASSKQATGFSSLFRRLKSFSNTPQAIGGASIINSGNSNNNQKKKHVWNGVTYQVVSGIPQSYQDLEDRATMAELAAASIGTEENNANSNTKCTDDTQNTTNPTDITTSAISSNSGASGGSSSNEKSSYIEKYIKAVSAVESLMEFDRIRQEAVAQEIASLTNKKKMTPIVGPQPPLNYPYANPYSNYDMGGATAAGMMVANGYPLNNNTQHPFYPVNPAAVVMGSQANLIKHISVPDFKGMFRSSSLMNLNNQIESSSTSRNHHRVNNSSDSDKMDFDQQTMKSDSIPNLADLSTITPTITPNTTPNKSNNNNPKQQSPLTVPRKHSMTTSTTMDTNNNNTNVVLKPALVPRRPKPPKNLMMLSKNQSSFQQMLNNPQSSQINQHPTNTNPSKYIKNSQTRQSYKQMTSSICDESSSSTKTSSYDSSITNHINSTNNNNNNNNIEE